MKLRKLILLMIVSALTGCMTSCATRGDDTFMTNASAAINGGLIATPSGAMMAPGLQNRNRVHPFFGAPE